MVPEPPPSTELVETLRDAQRLGFFGSRPVDQAAAHACAFLAPLRGLEPGSVLYDLGSGGGLPGLVIAEARPDLHVVLIDRRRKRTDFLQRATLRLQMPNLEVRCEDTAVTTALVTAGGLPCGDAVTARGFGPPALLLQTSAALLRRGGRVVVSEPPDGDRWSAEVLGEYGLRPVPHDADPGTAGRVQLMIRDGDPGL